MANNKAGQNMPEQLVGVADNMAGVDYLQTLQAATLALAFSLRAYLQEGERESDDSDLPYASIMDPAAALHIPAGWSPPIPNPNPESSLEENLLLFYMLHHVTILPDGTESYNEQPIMGSYTIVAYRLAEAIKNGTIDRDSVLRLIDRARGEQIAGATYSHSAATLYALAFADAQGANWELWEQHHEGAYTGAGGGWHEARLDNCVGDQIRNGASRTDAKKHCEGLLSSGNCANFVSTAMWLGGGLTPTDVWCPVDDKAFPFLDYYTDSGSVSWGTPDSQIAFFGQYGQSGFDISSEIYLYPFDNALGAQGKVEAEGFQALRSTNYVFGTGDLVYSEQHVAIVVGWGSPNGTIGDAFYPTYDEAVAAGIENPEPWAVDHGGTNPAGYARPWRQTIVGNAAGADFKLVVPRE